MAALNEPVARRIGKLVRMFGSPFENEGQVALTKLRALVDEERLTFHDIAVVIENADGEIEQLKYSDSDAETIFAQGVEKGRRENTGHALSKLDDDGEPHWMEIARFCESSPARTGLNPKEQEFLDEVPLKLRWRSLSRPQGGFLLSIFWKLGGTFR